MGDFIEYIKPVLIVSQILGLAFFYISERQTQFWFIFNSFLGVISISSYTAAFFWAVPLMRNHKYTLEKKDNDSIMFCIGVFNFYMLILSHLVLKKRIQKQIDLTSKYLSGRFGSTIERNQVLLQIFLVYVFVFVLTIVDFIANALQELLLVYLCTNVPIYINIFVIFINFIYAKQMRKEFLLLNECLTSVIFKRKDKNILKYIIYVLQVHKRLTEITQNTWDQVFCYGVLLQMSCSFLMGIFAVQLFLRYVFIWMNHQNDVITLALLALFWLSLETCMIFTLVWIWRALQREVCFLKKNLFELEYVLY